MEDNFTKSITALNNINNNEIWSGAAATFLCGKVEELIKSLKTEKENLEQFYYACNLLESLKQYDEEILRLKGNLIDITSIENQSELQDAESNNTYISGQIYTKTIERDKTRNEIETILLKFGIDADISIMDLSSFDAKNMEILYKYENGCVCEFSTSDGKVYEAYVPYQINPTAPIVIYDAGGNSGITTDTSGYEWGEWKVYFEEHGFDHIMMRSTRSDNSSYYADLCQKLDLTPESRLLVSWSGGFKRQFEEYYDLSEEQGSLPTVLGIMDSYVINDKKYIDKCKEEGTVLLCFYENNITHPAHDSYFSAGDENLNMLIFRDTSEFGESHGGMRESLYKNNVIDYLTGTGELPDNYVISYYNPNAENADSRGFVTVDHNDVKTLDDVYNFFGIDK